MCQNPGHAGAVGGNDSRESGKNALCPSAKTAQGERTFATSPSHQIIEVESWETRADRRERSVTTDSLGGSRWTRTQIPKRSRDACSKISRIPPKVPANSREKQIRLSSISKMGSPPSRKRRPDIRLNSRCIRDSSSRMRSLRVRSSCERYCMYILAWIMTLSLSTENPCKIEKVYRADKKRLKDTADCLRVFPLPVKCQLSYTAKEKEESVWQPTV